MNESVVKVSSNPSTKDELEISLKDILNFLRLHFVTIAICTLLGVAGGVAIYSYLPAKWQAEITLQIGKVPVMQNLDYIYPPAEVVERIQSPVFLSKMVSLMYGKNVASDSFAAQLVYKDLKASVARGSNLVKINVFGRTADEAYKNAGILAEYVIEDHHAQTASYLKMAENRLAEIAANIAQKNEVLSKVSSIDVSAPSKNEANALLKLSLIDARSSEIQALRTEQAKDEQLLSIAHLQVTSIVGRSLRPQEPSFPKRNILIVGGAFIGLLIGIIISYIFSTAHPALRNSARS